MSLFFDNQFINFPAKVKRVHDVSGAGDTVISVFALFDSVGLSPKNQHCFRILQQVWFARRWA